MLFEGEQIGIDFNMKKTQNKLAEKLLFFLIDQSSRYEFQWSVEG